MKSSRSEPQTQKLPSCAIIGAGKLGTSLALALYRQSLLRGVVVHSDAKAAALTELLPGAAIYSAPGDIPALPDYIFLTVQDGQIEALAAGLAEQFGAALSGRTVIHCSGALSTDILAFCAEQGARTASAHPFQTFYESSEHLFEGIAWGVECDGDSHELLELIIRLGGKPFLLPAETRRNKALYHISAVAASNFVVTAVAAANELSRLAGIPSDDFISPILQTTVQNCLRNLGPESDIPLTGPIVRGDTGTIQRHIEALRDHPHFLSIYTSMGIGTAELCIEKKLLSREKYNEIILLLKSA